MALKDLIQPRPVSEPDEKAEAVGSPPPPAAVEPVGVATSVTPSGIEIYYQAGPKRLYRIRDINIADSERTPLTDWTEVPSVSKINDELAAPGLTWWAMKIGVEGIMTLFDMVKDGTLDELEYLRFMSDHDVDMAVGLLTQNKITVNHVRDKAGDRGTAVHDALELWAQEGIVPIPSVYAPDEQGYVEGLRTFIEDCNPTPIVSEVMVASPTFLYAGRFDLGCNINQGTQAITKSYPKRKPVVSEIPGGAWILDLKTSKGVYESHHLQLAGYRQANEESWGVEVDHTGIIHVFDDGRYELVIGKATTEDWLRVRDLYDTMKRLK